MENITNNNSIDYLINSNKEIFNGKYIFRSEIIYGKIYKETKRKYIYLYFLNNKYNNFPSTTHFDSKEYGFKYSYYLFIIDPIYKIFKNIDYRADHIFIELYNKTTISKIKIK